MDMACAYDMHTAPSFAGHEFNIMPDYLATQRLREVGVEDEDFQINVRLDRAKTLNEFMRTKRFECQEHTYDAKSSTSMLHQRLGQCVQAMELRGGWEVDQSAAVRIRMSKQVVTGGFFLSFTQRVAGDRWLSDLFSDDIAMQNAETNSVCYMTARGPAVINPFWAGDFDIETGCDTALRGGNRLIDVKCRARFVDDDEVMLCGTAQQSYMNAVRAVEAPHCISDDRTVLLRVNMGTLADDQTPLCKRAPPDAICNRAHGALHGFTGTDALSLSRTATFAHTLEGVWDPSNEVLRGSAATADRLLAVRPLLSDIAGHSLVFRLTDAAGLRLRCLNLAGTHARTCERSVREWLAQVESEWERQHVFLRAVWPTTARANVHWHCPLQWLTAYSGLDRAFAAHTPSRERNVRRFAHITRDAFYAHPTVASAERVPGLRPARFMSETWACVAADTAGCHGSEPLRKTVAALRRPGAWHPVEYDAFSPCRRVLDWPHEAYVLRDGPARSAGLDEPEECNVYSRLPRFALSLTRGAVRAGPSIANATGGACHMGRLPRIRASLTTDADLQRCARRDGRLRCVALRDGKRETVDFEFAPAHAPCTRRAAAAAARARPGSSTTTSTPAARARPCRRRVGCSAPASSSRSPPNARSPPICAAACDTRQRDRLPAPR